MVQAPGRGRVGLTRDARLIITVQALRAFAYGVGSVLIGVSLARSHLSGTQVGVVFACILLGAAIASVALGRYGDEIGRRTAYRALLVVMAIAGTVFALTQSLPLLLLAALTGTVSTDVVESGPFTSLEQAMLPQTAAPGQTSRLFGTYNTVATLTGSLGALAAGLRALGAASPQRWLLVYPLAAALALPFAARLSNGIEAPSHGPGAPRAAAPVQGHRPAHVGAVCAGQLRRRLRHPELHRLLVHPPIPRLTRDARRRLLRHRPAPGGLLPGRRAHSRSGSACCARWCSPTCPPTCC